MRESFIQRVNHRLDAQAQRASRDARVIIPKSQLRAWGDRERATRQEPFSTFEQVTVRMPHVLDACQDEQSLRALAQTSTLFERACGASLYWRNALQNSLKVPLPAAAKGDYKSILRGLKALRREPQTWDPNFFTFFLEPTEFHLHLGLYERPGPDEEGYGSARDPGWDGCGPSPQEECRMFFERYLPTHFARRCDESRIRQVVAVLGELRQNRVTRATRLGAIPLIGSVAVAAALHFGTSAGHAYVASGTVVLGIALAISVGQRILGDALARAETSAAARARLDLDLINLVDTVAEVCSPTGASRVTPTL